MVDRWAHTKKDPSSSHIQIPCAFDIDAFLQSYTVFSLSLPLAEPGEIILLRPLKLQFPRLHTRQSWICLNQLHIALAFGIAFDIQLG